MPEELAFDCFVLILETSFFQEQNVVFVFSIMLQDSCAAFPVNIPHVQVHAAVCMCCCLCVNGSL